MSDTRHQKRAELMQRVFSATFDAASLKRELTETDPDSIIHQLLSSLEEIDAHIQSVATERPLHEINKVDLAILRVIVFESNNKKTPKKVLINEAVELAKSYSTEQSPSFINAVLAKLLLES